MGVSRQFKVFVASLFPFFVLPAQSAVVTVYKTAQGWTLQVDGLPTLIKGVIYQPTPAGEDPGTATQRDWMTVDNDGDGQIDSAAQSWVDANGNNQLDPEEFPIGDFQLLHDMGCNTIRLYHHASSQPTVKNLYKNDPSSTNLYNHAPNKKLLRDLFRTYGIRVAMGDLLGAYTVGSGASWDLGTDYRDPLQKANMLRSVEAMVRDHKDEPYLLLWILGNENNFSKKTHTNAGDSPTDYANFLNEATALIHRLDPHHPVCAAFGDVPDIKWAGTDPPAFDIVGINSYRRPGYGDLWAQVAHHYDRPVLLTEMGVGPLKMTANTVDETFQSDTHATNWRDIVAHTANGQETPHNALGGFVFEYIDNWWYEGLPDQQNGSAEGWHEEYMGLFSKGNGQDPLMRHPRPVYHMFQQLWTE